MSERVGALPAWGPLATEQAHTDLERLRASLQGLPGKTRSQLTRRLRLAKTAAGLVVPTALSRLRGGPRDEWLVDSCGRLAEALIELGPLYVKLGQVLATRSDLLPPAAAAPLARLQDECPPSPFAHVVTRLQAAIGAPVASVFRELEETPLASASVAQVHRAVTRSGQVVAVKVLKEDVAEKLAFDLRVLDELLRTAQVLVPGLRYFQLRAHFRELASALSQQANLELEAANQRELYERLQGHPYLRVPRPWPEYSSRDVLVMDFVTGIRGKQFRDVQLPPAQLARRLQHGMYTMMYLHGVFHADPHPGNLFFSPEGVITFVDFGLVGRLTEDEKWALSSFYFACSRRDWRRAAERFLRYFVIDRDGVERELERFMTEFCRVLRQHLDERRDGWSTVSFVRDGQRVLRGFGARYTPQFSQVALAFLTGEGFLSQIDPALDIWENARIFTDRASPYMSDELEVRFTAEFADKQRGSLALKQRAAQVLVAPTHLDRYFFPSQYPTFVEKAYGYTFEDVDGNRYIDLSSGYGPHILGYAHPVVSAALTSAAERGAVNAIGCGAEVRLAELIVGALPGCEKAVLSNSGTEAVMQAIRLCRAARGRDRIAKFEGHYHGFSDHGLVSSWFRFSGDATSPVAVAMPGVYKKALSDTLVLAYGAEQALATLSAQADTLACVVCEPLMSALARSSPEFLRELRELCTRRQLPLVFDEVVSGFRVAYGGQQALSGVRPDLTVLGKIVGGGLPCGAVAGRADLVDMCKSSGDPFVDFESRTFVGGTMSGNSLSTATGAAVLGHLRDHPELYSQLESITNSLADGLRGAAKEAGVDCFVRGYRSIFSMTFAHREARSVREQHAGSNYKANIGLAYYMRRYGVYMPELHTMLLSTAHDAAAIATVVESFERSLFEMKRDGFFDQ